MHDDDDDDDGDDDDGDDDDDDFEDEVMQCPTIAEHPLHLCVLSY
jgi:hypothetical protein